MKECIFGVAVGVVLGALLVQSSPKAKELVEKGKDIVKNKVEKMSK